MLTPVHRAHAARRVALVYRLDPVTATRALPAGVRAKVIRGRGVGVVMVTRFDKLRPRSLPLALGFSIVTCAHGVLAQWEDSRGLGDGLCVLRRDVDSRWLGPASGMVLPGAVHGARFAIADELAGIELEVESVDGQVQLDFHGLAGSEWPGCSMFLGAQEAAERIGLLRGQYLAAGHAVRRGGFALDSEGGAVECLAPARLGPSWFEDQARFPAGWAEFDCALSVRDVMCLWRASHRPQGFRTRRAPLLSPSEASSV